MAPPLLGNSAPPAGRGGPLDRTSWLRANAAVAAIAAVAILAACGEDAETDRSVTESPASPLTFVGGEVCEATGHKIVYPCIHCARCVEACPLFLNPSQLGLLAKSEEYERMASDYNLMDCFECGACSYVCPSHIPLVQYYRLAKKMVRKLSAKE